MPIANRSVVVVAVALQMFCAAASAAPRAGKEPIVGSITREQVRQILAEWKIDVSLQPASERDIQELKRVRRGATVRVFLGSWCDDSKLELRHFMRLLDAMASETPFAVDFVAVDEEKHEPASEVKSNQIWYLPTFIVLRNGHELGRIVEHPPHTLERDLLLLLDGSARGLLSSNENAIIRYLNSSTVADSQ
jgi:thiol-disulfide isomerase/thioredoxin